jgi:hypothetical protein
VSRQHRIETVFDRIIRHAEQEKEARVLASRRKIRLRFRETLATLAFGAGSLGLAIVMFNVIVLGLFGFRIAPWTESRTVWVEKTPREFVVTHDPISKAYESSPALVPWGQIGMPSPDCHLLAFLSLILGAIGLSLSLQRREVSWVSAAGFTLTFLMMGTVVACEMLLRISR